MTIAGARKIASIVFITMFPIGGKSVANTCAGGSRFYFVIDQGAVSYVDLNGGPTALPDADASTFAAFPFEHGGLCSTGKEEFYAKDKRGVFFKAARMSKARPATFSVLPLGLYAKDKNFVYYAGRAIKGADPKSFQLLRYIDDAPPRGRDWSDFAKDKRHVWKAGAIVPHADTKAFAGPRQTD